MGFVNTILNVYTARHGTWSIMAIVSTAVSGSFTVTTAVIYTILQCYILRRIKREHQSVVEGISPVPPRPESSSGTSICEPPRSGVITEHEER